MKLMVLDGNSIVNRAYYGVRPLTTRDGFFTHAIFGFLTMLSRLLDEEKPEALCVAFDRREPTFRHLEYEGYKATRHAMPEELAMQMPVLKEVLDAMNADSGVPLKELKVDGGMVSNELLMQFQADILDVEVVRPKVAETTALGAAYAAGIAVGFWEGEQDVIDNWAEAKRWTPADSGERDRLFRNWKKAVTRTFDWLDEDVVE